jgi:hypothetical protein
VLVKDVSNLGWHLTDLLLTVILWGAGMILRTTLKCLFLLIEHTQRSKRKVQKEEKVEVKPLQTIRKKVEAEGAWVFYEEFKNLEGSFYGEQLRSLQNAFYKIELFLTHYSSTEEGCVKVQNLITLLMAAKNCELGLNDHYPKEQLPLILFELCKQIKHEISEAAKSYESMIDGWNATSDFIEILYSGLVRRVERASAF